MPDLRFANILDTCCRKSQGSHQHIPQPISPMPTSFLLVHTVAHNTDCGGNLLLLLEENGFLGYMQDVDLSQVSEYPFQCLSKRKEADKMVVRCLLSNHMEER